MSDNMGGLDTFDVGYAVAKAECAEELYAPQQKLEAAERNSKEFERDWLDACDKNAELTRKLAEQNADNRKMVDRCCNYLQEIEEAGYEKEIAQDIRALMNERIKE